MKIVQKFVAVVYMLAGIAKAFPSIEDVAVALDKALEANRGGHLEPALQFFVNNSLVVTIFVGVALFISGLSLFVNRGLIRLVLACQLFMLSGFILFLRASQPEVYISSGLFIVITLALYRYHGMVNMKKRVKALPSNDYEKVTNVSSPGLSHFAPKNEYDCVVVGGGVSGLSATYKIKSKSVLVIEKSSFLGGNARYQDYSGIKYPTAGICFQLPKRNDYMKDLLIELGLWDKWQSTDKGTLVFFDTGLLVRCLGEVVVGVLKQPSCLFQLSLWGLTSSLFINWFSGYKYVKAQKNLGDPIFADLYSFLDKFGPETELYPSMPWNEGSGITREDMAALDSISLYSFLFEPEKLEGIRQELRPKSKFGRLALEAVETTLRVECLCIHEVSAYVGLHFLVGYFRGTLVTLPGGNGHISNKIVESLNKHINIDMLTDVSSVSISLKSSSNKKVVQFRHQNKAYNVEATAIIWAAPKYNIEQSIPFLPKQQLDAIRKINHHDYCLANVYLNRPVLHDWFGGYIIEPKDTKQVNGWCKTSTCLVANYIDTDSKEHSKTVLSLLKPVSESHRQSYIDTSPYQDIQASTQREISEVLINLGIDPLSIDDIRLWRWNKGLVVCKKGQLKDDVFVNASKSFKGIYFANQDSVGIGNIESAVNAGARAADGAAGFLCS